MRGSCLEREIPTGVEEDHDDANEADILGFIDDDIEFQVHNIEKNNTVMANLQSTRR
jgi:hypothetical protein